MKVIKVVHSIDDKDLIMEKELLALKEYDVDNFMKKYLEEMGDFLFTPMTEQLKLSGSAKVISKFLNLDINTQGKKNIFLATMLGMSKKMIQDISDKLTNIEILSLNEAKEKYPKTLNLSIGTYTLHPYDDKVLTKLEYYHKNLALDKDNELVILLGRMGAKNLRITLIDSNIKTKAAKITADIENFSIKANANVNAISELSNKSDLIVKFEGNSVEIPDDLLEKSIWFANDGQINTIFETRKFNPNRIKQYTLKNTYTDTFDFDFNLAGRYVIECDLLAEFHSISSKERLFEVEFA